MKQGSHVTPKPGQTPEFYKCMACGYVYDPAIGDPGEGIPAGTSFEELPADWLCPMCGIGKPWFQKQE